MITVVHTTVYILLLYAFYYYLTHINWYLGFRTEGLTHK